MRRFLLLLALPLAGCGTFPLGMVYPEKGQTSQQREQDTLVCKDKARTETDTNARVAGSFIAGLTIIGAPIAIEAAHEKFRQVFEQCMAERGYRVVRPK